MGNLPAISLREQVTLHDIRIILKQHAYQLYLDENKLHYMISV